MEEAIERFRRAIGDLPPMLTHRASNMEAPHHSGEVGRSPRALRPELMHPSGRSQTPHPTPLVKVWATGCSLSGRVFKSNYPSTSPCVSPPLREESCKQRKDKNGSN